VATDDQQIGLDLDGDLRDDFPRFADSQDPCDLKPFCDERRHIIVHLLHHEGIGSLYLVLVKFGNHVGGKGGRVSWGLFVLIRTQDMEGLWHGSRQCRREISRGKRWALYRSQRWSAAPKRMMLYTVASPVLPETLSDP